jgi:putative hemolysin
MVEQGAESGAVQPGEYQILENTFRLGDRQVVAIMTPRVDVSWIDTNASADAVLAALRSASHGRGLPLLVCDGDIEHVLGIVYPDDLLVHLLGGASLDIRSAVVESLFVPDSMPVLQLLESFRKKRQRTAVALDEYGGIVGVVTLDDILEALVGEVPHFGSASALEIERQPDGSWLVDASTAVDDLEALLDLESTEDSNRRGATTVGGLVMTLLGRLPKPGESVDHGGARITVERMTGRRIESTRIRTNIS